MGGATERIIRLLVDEMEACRNNEECVQVAVRRLGPVLEAGQAMRKVYNGMLGDKYDAALRAAQAAEELK